MEIERIGNNLDANAFDIWNAWNSKIKSKIHIICSATLENKGELEFFVRIDLSFRLRENVENPVKDEYVLDL